MFPRLCGRTLLRFLAAIGIALDRNDLGVMNQAIDHRDDTTGVGKHLRPRRESLVGRDQGTLLLMTAIDQFEQQISMAI